MVSGAPLRTVVHEQVRRDPGVRPPSPPAAPDRRAARDSNPRSDRRARRRPRRGVGAGPEQRPRHEKSGGHRPGRSSCMPMEGIRVHELNTWATSCSGAPRSTPERETRVPNLHRVAPFPGKLPEELVEPLGKLVGGLLLPRDRLELEHERPRCDVKCSAHGVHTSRRNKSAFRNRDWALPPFSSPAPRRRCTPSTGPTPCSRRKPVRQHRGIAPQGLFGERAVLASIPTVLNSGKREYSASISATAPFSG